jgi:iron complex outermembrane recepter protein
VRWPVLVHAQDRALYRGVEGHAEWEAAKGWVLGVQGDAIRARMSDGSRVPFLPPARAGASLRWDDGAASAGVALRRSFRARGDAAAEGPPVAAFTLLGAHAGYRLRRGGHVHAFTLRVDNAANVAHRDAASRIRDFAPNPGRNVSLLYRAYF